MVGLMGLEGFVSFLFWPFSVLHYLSQVFSSKVLVPVFRLHSTKTAAHIAFSAGQVKLDNLSSGINKIETILEMHCTV